MLTREIIEEAPGDWSVTVGGEFIGYTKTEQQAIAKANTYAHSLLSKQTVDNEPIKDVFSANQSSILMTVICPECYGPTHTIFTTYGDYRQCDADRGHMRVRVA